MAQINYSPKAGIWSRTKISTLSAILLVMMAFAGVFFTTAFGILNIDISQIQQDWVQIKSALDQAGVFKGSEDLLAKSTKLSALIEEIRFLTIFFIIAVLIAVGFFFILMYATLIHKVVKPIKRMESGIVEITSCNDFSKQLDVKYQDEVGQATSSFNRLTSNLKDTFDQININLEKVANGQFDQRCDVEVHGDLLSLKEGVDASIESVAITMASLENIAEAISNGDFTVRVDARVKGELKTKVDSAMASMDGIIEQINSVMKEVTNNDFSHRVVADAKGRLFELKSFINAAVEEISLSINKLNESVDFLSRGDLTYQIRVPFTGELEILRTNLNRATSQLDNTLGNVIETANKVVDGTMQIAQGNDDLSDRTQTQAASLEETASAMEQMTATVHQTSENAQRARKEATTTMNLANSGRTVMRQSVESMAAIQDSSERISDIVALIDSIAFQTNLLALNAAVEAARAGEHGRGFAVVASEVRNLAGKSADAAKDIRDLIDEIVEKVNNGATQLNETNEAFEQINQGIQTVNEIVSEIATRSEEQAIGINQVNQAISQLDSAVQQNAALVEETAASSANLTEYSASLKQEVAQFSVSPKSPAAQSPMALEDKT